MQAWVHQVTVHQREEVIIETVDRTLHRDVSVAVEIQGEVGEQGRD